MHSGVDQSGDSGHTGGPAPRQPLTHPTVKSEPGDPSRHLIATIAIDHIRTRTPKGMNSVLLLTLSVGILVDKAFQCSPGGKPGHPELLNQTGKRSGHVFNPSDLDLPEAGASSPVVVEATLMAANGGNDTDNRMSLAFPTRANDTNLKTRKEAGGQEDHWEILHHPAAQKSIIPAKWDPLNIKMNLETTTTLEADRPSKAPSTGSLVSVLVLFVVYNTKHVLQSTILSAMILAPQCTAQQLVGFDTAGRFSGNRKINMKVVSLLGVDPCDRIRSQSYSSPIEKPVQILYRPTETALEVLQCRIAVTVQILHCASSFFRSDIYPPDTVMKEQIMPITDAECREMHRSGVFELKIYDQSIFISGIKHTPQTLKRTLVGIKEPNGGCTGGEITIEGTHQTKKVVILEATYQARQLGGKYSSSSGTIFVGDLVSFPHGVDFQRRCDEHYGCFTVAQPDIIPQDRCQQTEQLLLGQGQLFVPNVGPEKISQGYLEILQVSSEADSTMGTALTLSDSEIICGVLVRKTNIPRLYTNFYEENGLVNHDLLNVSRPRGNPYAFLDVLTSSSNIYLRGTLSVSEQFDRVSFRLCELRRFALNNVLRDLLTAGPGPLLNYRRGLLFVKKGSVAYVFVGVPIKARLRNTELCFNEIPVVLETESQGEVDAFLTSKARIIVSNGTAVTCSNQSPMHFLRDFKDELHLFNDTLREQFPDLAFGDEDDSPHINGHWLCQISGNFIACQTPSSLSPIIGSGDHFYGVRGAFLSQSLFGHGGRENLYRSQVEGFNREVFLSKIGTNTNGGVPAHAGDLFINHLSDAARSQLRQLVLPTFYLIFGSLLEYVEQFIIALFILSFVMGIIKMMTRLVVVFKYYGCSRYLLIAFFEGLWNALIPWRSASRQKDRVIERMEMEISELESKLNNKVDRITDPSALTPSHNRPRTMYPSLPRRLDELIPLPKISIPANLDPNAPPAENREN